MMGSSLYFEVDSILFLKLIVFRYFFSFFTINLICEEVININPWCKNIHQPSDSGTEREGAEGVIFEYEHDDWAVKQNLQMLLDTVQEGDMIITLEVSRLSRSTKQLREIKEAMS